MTAGEQPRPQQVVLIRHGETEWSAAGRHTGRTDIPLTDEGRRQAQALGACLSRWRFGLILCSPLGRAVATAGLALPAQVATIRDDLREWDYGAYEGRTTADIRRERPGWNLWSDGVPNGETGAQVAARADRVVEEVRRGPEEVAVFGHGHALRVLAARWIEQEWSLGSRLFLGTASLGVLSFERETRVILEWGRSCPEA